MGYFGDAARCRQFGIAMSKSSPQQDLSYAEDLILWGYRSFRSGCRCAVIRRSSRPAETAKAPRSRRLDDLSTDWRQPRPSVGASAPGS